MKTAECLTVANEIFQAIFMRDNSYSLDELRTHFAQGIRLPAQVRDSSTHEETFSIILNHDLYITNQNSEKRGDEEGWILPYRDVGGDISQLEQIWHEINSITTERVFGSENVSASDPLYSSTNVYCSTNCGRSNNLVYCDGVFSSNYALACQRSESLNYCLNVNDSNSCTNSYQVICSGKISNSLFIQDCSSLHECIWCSHLTNQEYCIANMQFESSEYYCLKPKIIDYILSHI